MPPSNLALNPQKIGTGTEGNSFKLLWRLCRAGEAPSLRFRPKPACKRHPFGLLPTQRLLCFYVLPPALTPRPRSPAQNANTHCRVSKKTRFYDKISSFIRLEPDLRRKSTCVVFLLENLSVKSFSENLVHRSCDVHTLHTAVGSCHSTAFLFSDSTSKLASTLRL